VKRNVFALAKFTRPSARLIGREMLVSSLAAEAAPLLWIVGPAGSGKTSLGLEYTRTMAGPVAWLRLDEADVDPASFLHYFQQAVIGGAAAAEPWHMPQLLREHLPAPQGYFRLFLRSLATCIAGNACLVLDDAHKCQDAPYFRQFLDMLAEEMPPGVRTLVLSRTLPPDGCARLLANGQMHAIDAEALAFSATETERLLLGLGLAQAPAIRDAVFDHTHGWAAGVVLVASWFRRNPEAASRLDDIPQLVAGYLTTEVFSAFSDVERDTLLSICGLPYFRTAWASTLSGAPDAVSVLGRLAAQGALIYQYPGQQFTLHPLFQQFLREWSVERIDAGRRRQWAERGVELLRGDGSLEDAIELALDQSLMLSAANLMEGCAENMLASARHQTLGRWIGRLPEELRSPWHHYWLGLAFNVSDTGRARESFLKAYDAFTASGNHQFRFIALSMIVVSYSFNGVAREPLKAVLQRIGDVEHDYAQLTDVELRAHLTLGIYSGLTTTDPSHPAIPLWEQRSLAALSQEVSPEMKVRLAVWMTIHWFFSGQYRRISSLRVMLDGLVEAPAIPSYQRYLAFFLYLFDELVRSDHDALAKTFAASRQASEETGFRLMDGHYALQFVASRLLQGDLETTRAVLARVASTTPPGYYNQAGHLFIVQSWVAAWSGDTAAALEFSHRVREAGRGFGSASYELWGRTGACIAGTLSAAPDAAAQIAELRRMALDAGYASGRVHADLLDAWRLLQAGDEAGALPLLRDGLALLGRESEGFLWGAIPQILQPLCVLALRHGIEPDSACALVRTFRLAPPDDAPETWPWALAVRSLGGFDLRLDGKSLPSRGKSKHRQLELLKLVAAYAPTPVPLARIAEALWPDSDGDAARHALDTTLSRLRATFGREVFRIEHGALSLDGKICWIDTVATEARIARLEAAIAEGSSGIAAAADAVCSLYRGDLLAGDSTSWLLPRREYWRGRTARSLGGAVRCLVASDHFADALRLLEHALDADPYSEPLTAMLMRICLGEGRYAEGLAAYRRYRRIALSNLGTTVSSEIESLARSLEAGKA
jgi:DNA-binding SARP family transcriptional activator